MKNNYDNVFELLIVVDMINGFLKEGVLANKNALCTVPSNIELIKKIID